MNNGQQPDEIIGEFALKQCCWLLLNAKWENTVEATKIFKPVLDRVEARENIIAPLAKFIKYYEKQKPELP